VVHTSRTHTTRCFAHIVCHCIGCSCVTQVLWGNRNVAFIIVLPLALAAEGTSWKWVTVLRPSDWGALVFIGGWCKTDS